MMEETSEIEKRDDRDRLIKIIRNGKYIEQMNAIDELMGRREEKAVVSLIMALNGGYSQEAVIEALIDMGDMTIGPIMQCWPTLYLDTQKSLIYVLRSIGSDKAVDALIDLMNDKDGLARTDAIYSLGIIGGKKVAETLFNALNDDNFAVRVAAYKALECAGIDDIDLGSILKQVETQCIKMESDALDMMKKIGEKMPAEPILVTVGGGSISKRKPTRITPTDQDESNKMRFSESHLSFMIYVWRMMKLAQKKMHID